MQQEKRTSGGYSYVDEEGRTHLVICHVCSKKNNPNPNYPNLCSHCGYEDN